MATMSLSARSAVATAPAWSDAIESAGGQSIAALLDPSDARTLQASAFAAHGIIGHSAALPRSCSR